ncbi:MAG TPA: hypothetical protein VJU13_13025 [Candidatus Nitrosocosmicus sp.]|nr:hypothetical protein [Candidatus Nitrosocosmicus sp.]
MTNKITPAYLFRNLSERKMNLIYGRNYSKIHNKFNHDATIDFAHNDSTHTHMSNHESSHIFTAKKIRNY